MRLIAPFINDLSRYEHEPVFTVYNGKPVEARITTDPERIDDLIYHLDEVEHNHYPVIPVKTYRDVVDSYVNHPERKYDDENGNPCTGETRGRLYPTRIVISEYQHISKTGMEELTAEKTLQTDHYKIYANDGPERVRDLTKQILRDRYNGRELARELSRRGTDASVRTVYNFLDPRKTTMPRADLFNALVSLARDLAARELNAAGIHVPSRYSDSQIFSMWLTARKGK